MSRYSVSFLQEREYLFTLVITMMHVNALDVYIFIFNENVELVFSRLLAEIAFSEYRALARLETAAWTQTHT